MEHEGVGPRPLGARERTLVVVVVAVLVLVVVVVVVVVLIVVADGGGRQRATGVPANLPAGRRHEDALHCRLGCQVGDDVGRVVDGDDGCTRVLLGRRLREKYATHTPSQVFRNC